MTIIWNEKIRTIIRQNTKKDIKLFNSKIELKQFQVVRLKETYKDLLESEQTKESALFFLNEIYSFKDLTKRDSDLEKLLPTM